MPLRVTFGTSGALDRFGPAVCARLGRTRSGHRFASSPRCARRQDPKVGPRQARGAGEGTRCSGRAGAAAARAG